ncbi:MAG: hypothetical protein J6Q28_03370 [Alistipes sp.]|nr:hypothetical protein [Alistipes sp.]
MNRFEREIAELSYQSDWKENYQKVWAVVKKYIKEYERSIAFRESADENWKIMFFAFEVDNTEYIYHITRNDELQIQSFQLERIITKYSSTVLVSSEDEPTALHSLLHRAVADGLLREV